MPEDYKAKLQKLLRKLFQFDIADLDFGIYRIMNQKRDKIEKFIEKDIIETVDSEFERYEMANKEEIQKQLGEIKKKIGDTLGVDAIKPSGEIKEEYKTLPIAKEYYKKKEELKNAEITDQQKAEIFSHIYQFFSRYYHDGDFLSLRRYSKQNKYAIPYNGEEVLLHWANMDQYYIKTGEYFKNYSFDVGDYKVIFRLSNAEIEQNSNKSDKRYFILKEGDGNIVFEEDKKELTILFEYRGLNDEEEDKYGTKNVQQNIINSIKDIIFEGVRDGGLKTSLRKIKDEKTLLEKHLYTYTKRNTTDYFIHKDLKVFLDKELDFYIKNEVLMLDDLGSENAVSIEKYITRVKVIKAISQKIIEFLAQIEDFQKKLWEKKKFVIKTDYCMTLDKVPDEFYEEITQNVAQINEWKELFKLEEVEKGTLNYSANGGLKIDADYFKTHPFLVLDTKFFGQNFKDRLLATFEDLDEEIGGVMIKSENWQALNLLLKKYVGKVKCIYIDPPYNTGKEEFIYKDNYQHSSWLTMMDDRLRLTQSFLASDGIMYLSIDDNEAPRARSVMENIWGFENFVAQLVWKKKYTGGKHAKHFVDLHEYILAYAKDGSQLRELLMERPEEELGKFEYNDEYFEERGKYYIRPLKSNLAERPTLVYPIKMPDDKEVTTQWIVSRPTFEDLLKDGRIEFRKKRDGEYQVYKKYYEKDAGGKVKPPSLIEHTNNNEAKLELKRLFHVEEGRYNVFYTVKPVALLTYLIKPVDSSQKWILDYFAGSGTTAHAVLALNKEDIGNRKYILVEMADYFDTVMKPRIQKVVFSSDWKDGIPTSTDGISHMFKYMYLEQYEDTLNNIEFMAYGKVQKTLEDLEGYFLRYMLDFETRDSITRLNVDKLTRPFEYKLKITNENETREEVVDLVETFNYLLGLHVKRIKTYKNNGTDYRVVFGEKDKDSIAVIWRNTDDLDLNADKEFTENSVLKDFDAGKVYVNGSSYIENALPIEPEFKRRMGG